MTIDLNSDLGESYGVGDDAAMQDLDSSANVACGFHAGDPAGILALRAAAACGVAVAREAGLRTAAEAFADRGNRADGSLVPRNQPGAVLHDPEAIAARMLQLVRHGTLTADDGSAVHVEAESICVHGDSPGAVTMARRLRERLEAEGVAIRAFADAPAALEA